ncbi:hypothetical protein BDQ12DRAFT_703689 [Crucibulum laeve]|uniref:phosphatidylinositol-3,4,5-trisphosphate 3-phosphatase n=1 Tax=Crucibulum laeve TaxID=68775 RepID=A0A5C3M8S5_9AGAR|nr:hypothetical protein BDQ12DRAFT_703689 [Crucibulum laeve]
MTDYIRRLVSGNKARFKDAKLNVELDLVYVTDQVIIMGYPASGMEGLYRNRREDAKKFLEHRHGKNYWIYNFCPIRENSYDAAYFDGRVSRYPFPDHHAPPLAIMPLVAREIRAWLSGSPERVAVLHCKAGKGRSGTMACTYLLSLDDQPTPPKLERSYNAKQWAEQRAESTMNSMPDDTDPSEEPKHDLEPVFESPAPSDTAHILAAEETGSPPAMMTALSPDSVNPEKSFTDSLKGVLDLHTARRMKAPSDGKKVKQGVSIPSQRRWLHYWALMLAHEAPDYLWCSQPSPFASEPVSEASSVTSRASPTAKAIKNLKEKPKVRLTEIKVRMRETSGMKMNIVKMANVVIDRAKDSKAATTASKGKGANHVWASLARYDDNLVQFLEKWEVHTRDEEGRMGHRRKGSEHMQVAEDQKEHELGKLFEGGKWDTKKMVRSFARMGEDGEVTEVREKVCIDSITTTGKHLIGIQDEKILSYILRPLTEKRWEGISEDINSSAQDKSHLDAETIDLPKSEVNSVYDVPISSPAKRDREVGKGVLLDSGREVRVKLYLGQVFMGWVWFIPAFHMPQPPPSSSNPNPATPSKKFVLTRKEVDFPVGIGSGLVDVEISMEWVTPEDVHRAEDLADVEPPPRAKSGDALDDTTEPGGLAATVQAIVGSAGEEGPGGLREAVEVKQGVET